jgi:transposase
MQRIISLSSKELDRSSTIQRVLNNLISRKEAAVSLDITDRQLRRLILRYEENGAAGLVNLKRGKPSNNKLSSTVRDKAIELVKSKYLDFGPTLASEKLEERDNIKINPETLRKLMILEGLWKPKKRKPTHRTRRERRDCFGEMEQFDGCRHDWFEGRLPGGEWATLLANRDDANNNVVARFMPYEGTVPVMTYWRDYIKKYGKPVDIYLDRHSTYKVNSKSAVDDDRMISQFERAAQELGIGIIHANSPQAKGRIENLFGTLQDRLVKELRLEGISDIESANKFLEDTFLPAYNKKFSVEPKSSSNLHKPLNAKDDLDRSFSVQTNRYINEDFTIRYLNSWFQLTKVQPTLVVPGSRVTIEERLDDGVHIRLNEKYLNYEKLKAEPVKSRKLKHPVALTSSPGIDLSTRRPNVPSKNHPWRKFQLLPYNVTNKYTQKPPSKKMS